jgi:hypothetical protein
LIRDLTIGTRAESDGSKRYAITRIEWDEDGRLPERTAAAVRQQKRLRAMRVEEYAARIARQATGAL